MKNLIRDQSGSILLLTVLTVSVLSVAAVGSAYASWLELRMNRDALRHIQERRLSEAAITSQYARLPAFSATTMGFADAWAKPMDDRRSWTVKDGTLAFERSSPSGPRLWGVEDEQGRLHLNLATRDQLLRLLGEGSDDVVSAILAWRSPLSDDQRETWNSWYGSQATPYVDKEAPFQSVEELRMIKGMTAERYQRVRPWVTVYGTGQVNLNTAPAEVLRVLGLDAPLVERIIRTRAGPDTIEGTDDDQVFTNLGTVPAVLEKAGEWTSEQRQQWNAARSSLTLRTQAFRIHLSLWPGQSTPAGDPTGRYEIVLTAAPLEGKWIIRRCLRV